MPIELTTKHRTDHTDKKDTDMGQQTWTYIDQPTDQK